MVVYLKRKKPLLIIAAAVLLAAVMAVIGLIYASAQKEEIKWIDFNLTEEIMSEALRCDIASHNNTENDENQTTVSFIDLLAFAAAESYGNESQCKKGDITRAAELAQNESPLEDACKSKSLYNYYRQVYSAVLGGLVGEYSIQKNGEWQTCYGLKAFCPIAEGYYFSHYDDFGASRSYGYKRSHLGHDLLGSAGTPIIATESGTVEELGWNRYGGWRVGIRSLDGKRYYYYAHLQKGHPFATGLKKGDTVLAGDVIGYMGRTGYSTTEDTNGMDITHLHFGLQIILNGGDKESGTQIWIDLYELTKFLSGHKSTVCLCENGTDYKRKYPLCDFSAEIAAAANITPKNSVTITVIMYHSVQKSSNGQNKYIITPAQFEDDLKYLRANGYKTVTVSDLYDFVYSDGSLPQKCVMLTFDDGYYNNMYYIYPLLARYSQRAVISVVGGYCDAEQGESSSSPAYSYLKWHQVSELNRSGYVEIQNHSYNLHTIDGVGIKKLWNESEDEYYNRVLTDITKMQQLTLKNCGFTPTAFFYPYGEASTTTEKAVKAAGLCASFTCYEGINIIEKGNDECLYMLKRNIRTPQTSVQSILNRYSNN